MRRMNLFLPFLTKLKREKYNLRFILTNRVRNRLSVAILKNITNIYLILLPCFQIGSKQQNPYSSIASFGLEFGSFLCISLVIIQTIPFILLGSLAYCYQLPFSRPTSPFMCLSQNTCLQKNMRSYSYTVFTR